MQSIVPFPDLSGPLNVRLHQGDLLQLLAGDHARRVAPLDGSCAKPRHIMPHAVATPDATQWLKVETQCMVAYIVQQSQKQDCPSTIP